MAIRLTLYLLALALLPTAGWAQTCYPDSIPASTPTSRFLDNGDGTVTDTATALIWKRCAEGMAWEANNATCTGSQASFTWQAALQRPMVVNAGGGYAGQSDWRLPNVKELRSIVEVQCTSPSINMVVFPNASASSFWLGSPIAGNSTSAWSMFFRYGNDYGSARGSAYAVRLVRAGQ